MTEQQNQELYWLLWRDAANYVRCPELTTLYFKIARHHRPSVFAHTCMLPDPHAAAPWSRSRRPVGTIHDEWFQLTPLRPLISVGRTF